MRFHGRLVSSSTEYFTYSVGELCRRREHSLPGETFYEKLVVARPHFLGRSSSRRFGIHLSISCSSGIARSCWLALLLCIRNGIILDRPCCVFMHVGGHNLLRGFPELVISNPIGTVSFRWHDARYSCDDNLFTRLDKVVEQAAFKTNTSSNTTCASLAFSLLIVALYYLCSTLFLTILSPFDMLSEKVTLPKVFSLATLHSSKYILSAAAILVFCLAITEAYFDAQKLINLMAEDGLVSRKFANRRRVKQSRDWKRVPALSVLVISISSIPLLTWLRLENLILGFCIASMMISIVINSTAIVVQYKPTLADTNPEANEDTCLPKWEYNRYTIIRVLLCFGYITHERCLSALGVSEKTKAVNQTSKLVNCLVVQYILSCIGLSLAMFHGLPVIGWMFWIMLGALILLILSLFLTVRMILIQPRAKESLFESNFVSSFVPLLNIALFLILLVSIKWIAFAAVGVWLGLGKITCKSHCMAFFFFFTVKYTLQT